MNEVFIKYSKLPRYEISNLGNVRSIETKRPIKQMNGKSGYLRICPVSGSRTDKTRKTVNLKIHRMVAEVFVLNLQNKETVNHKDGNKRNNNYLNLEWMTVLENNQHAKRLGLVSNYKPTIEHRNKMKEGWYRYIKTVNFKRDSLGRYTGEKSYLNALKGN